MTLICKFCKKKLKSNSFYLLHLKLFHRAENDFPCGKCSRSFSSKRVLQKHIQNCSSTKKIQRYKKIIGNCEKQSSNDASASVELNSENTAIHTSPSLFDNTLMFISKFYSNPSMTRKSIQEIIDSSSVLFAHFSDDIMKEIKSLNILDEIALEKISSIVNKKPFQPFCTEYKRFRLFESMNTLIKPEAFKLGEIFDNKTNCQSISMDLKTCEAYIVPIQKVLKSVLEISGIMEKLIRHIENESMSNDTISSIFSSLLWKRIKSKYCNKLLLPLFVYFDDYEPLNPLGTAAGVYKIGAVYFTIGAIPPSFSSKLTNIFLWGLFHSADRKTFGNKKVFSKFIEDMKILESEGIEVCYGNEIIRVYFCLFALIGDNLGIHSITGFTESFSAEFTCRICQCQKKTQHSMVEEDPDLIRTEENYETNLEQKSFGITEPCFWNELSTYHNITNSSCDIMHDIYEGVCRYDLGHILYYYVVTKKIFSLEILNERIKYFDYNDLCDIGNRIPQITKRQLDNRNIIISASEMAAFVGYILFIIGDLIEENDEVTSFLCLLVEIVYIVSKATTSCEELDYLGHLIKNHNQLYVSLFQDTLKPKHHMLIHYPNIIKKVGPLCFLSSIRFEAFHKIAKTNAHIISSRRNIIFTLSMRHQFQLSYRLLSQEGFVECIELGHSAIPRDLFDDDSLKEKLDQVGLQKNAVLVNSLTINKITYKPNLCLQVHHNEFEPQYAKILCIIYESDSKIYFYCESLRSIGYSTHYQGFIVENDGNAHKKLINFNSLSCIFPVALHKMNDRNLRIIHKFKQSL